MKTIGIFYGSTTGTTENVAERIGKALLCNEIFSASEFNVENAKKYDLIILGSSTWGSGELQDDWYDAIKTFDSTELKGKMVAIFGCGDSSSYSDTFCDAMGQIYDAAHKCGCNIIGSVSTDGYTFDSSNSVRDGQFVGLAIDEDNEASMSEKRIDDWIVKIKSCIVE